MVQTSFPVSVVSLSDLLARFTVVAQNLSTFASLSTSNFYENYSHVKHQLEKLRRLCQNYPSLRYIHRLHRDDRQLKLAASTSVRHALILHMQKIIF